MGDGTGCDNMTAVIAKLKPNAFSAADKKAAVTAAAADSSSSDLTEKVKLKAAAETEVVNEAAVKRPAEDEPDNKERIPEPQAKKAKTDSDDNDTATEEKTTAELPEKEAEETKTEPETV